MKKVITYGTYDRLHRGHVRLLERAKALGDHLIVGITSDDYDKTRGKINAAQSLMERLEAVRATGLADDELRRKWYNFVCMAGDTAEQAEKEDAVFTSGAIIGSESFVNRIVKEDEESFPTGHKTSPVNFGIGGVVLKTLRNLSVLR